MLNNKEEDIMSAIGFNQHDLVDVAVKGVFCVKLPANVRSTGAWKVWTPKLLLIKPQIGEITSRTHNNRLILTIFKSTKIKDTSQGFVIQEILNPSRTIIFRCKSRKKPHAFTIYGDGKPLVHISGDSETESQLLIRSIRNLLWPANPIISLSKALGGVFEVSIIDNEMSYRAGLLGVCGYLTITSDKVTLTCPQTGHIIQEWTMSSVSFKLVPQVNLKDNNKVVNMMTTDTSSTGLGNILIYCEESSELISQFNRVRGNQHQSQGSSYSDELIQNLNITTSEYDLMTRFDDLDYSPDSNQSQSSTSNRSSFNPPSTSSTTTSNSSSSLFSLNQPLESSYNLSSSWSTNISIPWTSSGSDHHVIYDVPRPVNLTKSTDNQSISSCSSSSSSSSPSPDYATIKRFPASNQQSILNTIDNLSSSLLDCSLNCKQQWIPSTKSNYLPFEQSNLASSLPATVTTLQDNKDHIYEEIRAIKEKLEQSNHNYNTDFNDIYEIIEPFKGSNLIDENENIDSDIGEKSSQVINHNNQLINEKIIVPMKNESETIDDVNQLKQSKSIVKSSPKRISRFNYFKLRRTLSESWFNSQFSSKSNLK